MTAQIRERLLCDGVERQLATLPLAAYFGDADPIPTLYDQPDAGRPVHHTALWRGYVGYWGLTETALVLRRLCIWGKKPEGPKLAGMVVMPTLEADLSRMFPGRAVPVVADWYSGTLHLPEGEHLYYAHIGFGGLYRYERRIEIEAGRVARVEVHDNTERFLSGFKADSLDLDYPLVNGRAFGIEPLCWLTAEGCALIKDKLGIRVGRRRGR